MVTTVVKTVGSTGDYSLPQTWADAGPTNCTTSRNATTVTGSTSSTIILDASASGTNDFYLGHAVWADARPAEKRLITAYNGTTKVATIGALNGSSATWANIPAIEAFTIDSTLWQGQAQNQTFTFTGSAAIGLSLSGVTTSSTEYRDFTCAAGASFKDNIGSSALKASASYGAIFVSSTLDGNPIAQVAEANSRIRAMQFLVTTPTSLQALGIFKGRFDDCIIDIDSTGYALLRITTGNNILAIQRKSASSMFQLTSEPTTCTNCTFVVPSDKTAVGNMLQSSYTYTRLFNNCAFFGCTNVANNLAGLTFTTCKTDSSQSITGVTQVNYDTSTGSGFVGITNAASDYNLVSTSALIDAGTTYSSVTPTDILGTARPQGAAYDIGCREYVSAAVAFIAKSYKYTVAAIRGSY
jgi:hypothetical protein